MRDLSESVALVTGGSRGIGRGLAVALAEAGATVYTCARSHDGLDETVDQLEGDGELIAQSADVTKPEQIARLVGRITAAEGRLDILVNNAGILGPRAEIEEVDLEEWRQVMRVNVDGPFIVSKAAIPLLRESDGSVVINISSSVGRRGRGGWGPYAVSKHGLEGLTDTLADELEADQTCVVSANPGGTATEMRAAAYPEEDPESIPSAEEVADTLLLMAQVLEVEQTGAKYNCRDLFDALEADERPGGGELPTA